MKTLALDTGWDVYVDELGNIATKEGNDRLAQDVSSSVRVFIGEIPTDLERGVRYASVDTNREYLNEEMNRQALLVDGVDESLVVFDKIEDRTLHASIYVTNENGEEIIVGEDIQ